MTLENDWEVWVYPPRVSTDPPPGVMVTDDLDEAALTALRAGGRMLLLIPPDRVKGDALGKVALGFSSIFWNTAWTHRQGPHTLGILCDPKHAALAHFPTDDHSNWQWWYLVSRAGAMILDGLPAALRPTVQVIDDWFTNRKLALVFEAKVAGGRLLVSSIDLSARLDGNPVARQMRHSLLSYAAGTRFKPTVELTVEQVKGLMEPGTARETRSGHADFYKKQSMRLSTALTHPDDRPGRPAGWFDVAGPDPLTGCASSARHDRLRARSPLGGHFGRKSGSM